MSNHLNNEELRNIENRPFSRQPDDYDKWVLHTFRQGIKEDEYGMCGRKCTKEEWESSRKEEA